MQETTHTHQASIDIATDTQAIFGALTDPAKLSTWWTSRATSEPRVGGAFRYEWNFAPGSPKEDHVQQGTYTAFEPGRLVAYPWQAITETEVRFTLESTSEGTRVELCHSGIPDNAEVLQQLKDGWTFFMTNLKSVLEGGPDGRGQMGLVIG